MQSVAKEVFEEHRGQRLQNESSPQSGTAGTVRVGVEPSVEQVPPLPILGGQDTAERREAAEATC